jgi:hypothetical protein
MIKASYCKHISYAALFIPTLSVSEMADRIYNMVWNKAWTACLSNIPAASSEQIQYKGRVSP